MVLASFLVVLALLAFMVLSPLAFQSYNDGDVALGGMSDYYVIDNLVEERNYQAALIIVDSIIVDNNDGLGRFAYFDRFLPDEEFENASKRRSVIYDLQWKRIEILQASGDIENLKHDLKRYSRIVGYHQEEAKAMLNLLND